MFVKSKIESRMLEYVQVLRSGVALHNASSKVTRQEWRQYISGCEIKRWFPGIQCLGVAFPVAKQDIAAFERSIHEEGYPEFKISPEYDRENYTTIKFIEPFNWRNERAFGYDMYSNPVRRKAMDRATSTGLASISGKITLVQETDQDVQSGMLCYLPIYRNDAELETKAQRQNALEGWVYAAFRCNDLMSGILDDHRSELDLELFDAREATAESVLFSSHPKAKDPGHAKGFSSVVPINLSGRVWTMRLEAKPAFFTATESVVSTAAAATGGLVSLLLYVVLLSITRQRALAIELAEDMTLGLVESERRTRSILENASEAILSVSEQGVISAANRASFTTFMAPNSMVNMPIDHLLVGTTFPELVRSCGLANGSVMTTCRRMDGTSFQCSVSIGKVDLHDELNYIVVAKDETVRIEADEQLAVKNRQLVLASHKAGRAEVAIGVLHNVGNVLNSVNVSTTILNEKLTTSSVEVLKKGVDMLCQHESGTTDFLTEHERGKHFPEFIKQVTETLISERDHELEEVRSLVKNVEHIREIVTAQQSSASRRRIVEPIQIQSLIDSAIKINEARMSGYDVRIDVEVLCEQTVDSEQHPILQILVNLIKNAQEACFDSESPNVGISAVDEAGFVRVNVTDNGVGISPDQLKRLFQHGFTTKSNGHGFGLHAAAITATELGGSLTAHSDGQNRGATFTLRIPVTRTESAAT